MVGFRSSPGGERRIHRRRCDVVSVLLSVLTFILKKSHINNKAGLLMESSICQERSFEQNVDWILMNEYITFMENNQFWLKSKWIPSPRLTVWLRWQKLATFVTLLCLSSCSFRSFSDNFILCDYKCLGNPTSELLLWALPHWQGASGGQFQDWPPQLKP